MELVNNSKEEFKVIFDDESDIFMFIIPLKFIPIGYEGIVGRGM